MNWLSTAAAGKGPRRFVLSVGRDGVMIPIVKNQKYKEAAAATVSVLDRWGRRLGTVYLGQMPEAQQTTLGNDLTRLLKDVLFCWEGPLPRLVYVTDCGHHPTVYFKEVLSVMIHPHPAQGKPPVGMGGGLLSCLPVHHESGRGDLWQGSPSDGLGKAGSGGC